MTVTDTLLRCMLEMGLSESGAMFHVDRIAAGVMRDLERERRDRAIRDLLPHLGADATASRFGVHRSTAYRALKIVAPNNDSCDKKKIA